MGHTLHTYSPPSSKTHFLNEYLAVMDELAAENSGYPLWWGTKIASKNRFTSPLVGLFLGTGEERPKYFRRALHAIVRIVDLCKSGFRIAARARKANKLFRVQLSSVSFSYIIKSFAYTSSIRDGKYSDPFFGNLSEYISRISPNDRAVLTVVTVFDESDITLKGLTQTQNGYVVPLEYFLSPADIFCGVLVVLRYFFSPPFNIPSKLSFLGNEVSFDVRETLRHLSCEIPLYDYLHRAAATKLARDYDILGCTITYEGNPWERMFVAGLKAIKPNVYVTGSQHSVVPLAAAGVFPGPNEIAAAPLPDVILTTGEEPARLMREYSAYPAARIIPACALRYGYLYGLPPKTQRSQSGLFTVLVTPEGTNEAVDLIAYSLKQANRCPDVHFRIRTHPLVPLSYYLNVLGVTLDSYRNVSCSGYIEIVEDITHCDAVLYWGSTVALEALMIGTPLIHFNRQDVLSNDPLFHFSDFKWTVDKATDLIDIINSIISLSNEEYSHRSTVGRKYVESYFHPVNDQAMSLFLPPGWSSAS